ncbi:MAG: Do family serine endopeptidase [Candidatus Eisenbacteria bacterium]|nr:Do family serine endopeptidase [Candidatus Eisenbacteria bacterium]
MKVWSPTMRRGSLAPVLLVLALFASPPPAVAQEQGETAIAAARSLGNAFAVISERTLPAVVTITSERVVSMSDRFRGTPFDEFFERFGPFGGRDRQREYRQRGLGSGFIVSADGIVLTSSHVVHEAQNIRVTLLDDREFDAEIVGTDPETDVAVLRIESDAPLPHLALGSSEEIRTGEWVLALGNPFGVPLQGTVTAGIVSAKGRSRIGLASYEDFIQTDAAINPGNSGGPLVNLRGKVVGINTAIASRTGGYQGVGFAIPIDLARHIMRSLIDEGRVVRGWLGVYIQDLDENLRSALESDLRGGALVSEVMEDSPAEEAGIEAGDILIEIDGAPLEGVDDLRLRVASMVPGSEADFTLLRDGDRRRISVEIGERDPDEPMAAGPGDGENLPDLGFDVDNLDAEWRERLDLDEETGGVVVTEVDRVSEAARAGLRVGSVIIEADRQPVESVRDLRAIIDELQPGETLLLYVITETARRFIAVPIPE